MRVKFTIGAVFPAGDPVSQFLTGLCMIVYDVTLVMRHLDRIYETAEGKSGESTYYLYLTCGYYREAAHFLEMSLRSQVVESYLKGLSPEGRKHLATLRESYTPWERSFVKDVVKPIRDVVFHYKPWSLERVAPYLTAASEDAATIELGSGTYLDTRYGFADKVIERYVHKVWGGSEAELTPVLEKMVELVLALTYFAHEAVTLRLGEHGSEVFEVEDEAQ